jgi:hypothetical protein
MQWNLSYQRQLNANWMMSATYIGNQTRHIWASTDVNYAVYTGSPTTSTTSNTAQRRLTYLVNPSQGQYYGDIEQTDDGAVAAYNGLLLKVEHRLANHFTALSTFTWGHCTSDWDFGGELTGPLYQNPLNRSAEHGACSFDHRFNSTTSLVATSGSMGSSTALKMITRNWQLSPIFSLLSGAPLQISDGGVDNSRSGQGADRPNVVAPGSVIPANQTVTEWFNPAAFAVQPIGTFGNLGRDAVYGPGTIQLDVALSRLFELSKEGRIKLQFRADIFNIMNHANWNNPTTSITSGTFGQITAFGSPRIIQMALKLYF